jgi:hypothetical protein
LEAKEHQTKSFQYKRLDIKREWNDSQTMRSDLRGTDRHKKSQALDVAEEDGQVVLDNLRSCLKTGHPVSFGFYWSFPNERVGKWDIQYDRSETNDLLDSQKAKWILKEIPSDLRHVGLGTIASRKNWKKPGHAVLAIGYQDDIHDHTGKRGHVLVQNSWGSDSETQLAPYFWMPYSWVTDFSGTMDFWMIDLEAAEPPPPPKPEEPETKTEDANRGPI